MTILKAMVENGSFENKLIYLPELWVRGVTLFLYQGRTRNKSLSNRPLRFFHFIESLQFHVT